MHASAPHEGVRTPEVDEVASARPLMFQGFFMWEHLKVQGAAGVLPQAASGIEQRPPTFVLIKIHPHMAHPQDGQQGFAAQR